MEGLRRIIFPFFLMALLFAGPPSVTFADFSDFYYSITQDEGGIDPDTGLTVFRTLLIPIGGKYGGMGTAFTAVSDDSTYIEANPSGSSLLEYTELAFSHYNVISDTNMEGVLYSMRFNDLGIGFGGKFLYVPFTEYDAFGERDSRGYYSETIGTVNISYNFLSSYYFYGIAVGTNLKVGYRSIPQAISAGQAETNQSALAAMADVGVLTRFNFLKFYASRSRNFSIGAVVKNLGPNVLGEPLPTEATVGMAYSPIRPLTMAFDFGAPFTFDRVNYPAESPYIAAGVDVVFTDFYSLQAGFNIKLIGADPQVSLGSVVELKDIRFIINYYLDLTTSSTAPSNFSIQAQLKLGDRGRAEKQALIDEYYTAGLEAYAEGQLREAIDYWNKVLEIEPFFEPASEMKRTAQYALELQETMESIQRIE